MICYKSKTFANGEHPIMLRISKAGKRKYASLGISLKAEKTFIYNHIKTIDMKKFRCYYTVKTTYYVEVLAQDAFEAKEKYDNGETLGEPEIFPVPQEPFAQVAIEEVKQPPARKIPCPP